MNASHTAPAAAPGSAPTTTTEPQPKPDVEVPQPAPSWRSRTVTNEQREEWIDKHMPFLLSRRD